MTLDAMRGIAALFVVARHFGDLRGVHEMPFSYLAVDLFFLLSGFVLSRSYSDRFRNGMKIKEFLIRRLMRLYPLYILGIAISLSLALYDCVQGHLSAPALAKMAATSLLFLPSPTWDFSVALFPLMVPAWSLFFELYVANGLFAAGRGRIRLEILSAVIAASAVFLVYADWSYGSLDVGATWPTLAGGLARVCFSFFAGVLLQRAHACRPPGARAPSVIFIGFLTAILSCSFYGLMGRAYELVCVVLLFPALVYLGAEALEVRPWIGTALGDASYALYVVHYPLISIYARILERIHLHPGYWAEGLFLLVVTLLAFALHHFYDKPVRAAMSDWMAHHAMIPRR